MTMQRYTVTHSSPLDDEDEDRPAPAGVLAIGDDLHLEIVSTEPDFAETMELAVEMLNASDKFLVHTDPPDQRTRQISKRVVPRNASGAREAMFEVLRQRYGFELTPAGPGA